MSKFTGQHESQPDTSERSTGRLDLRASSVQHAADRRDPYSKRDEAKVRAAFRNNFSVKLNFFRTLEENLMHSANKDIVVNIGTCVNCLNSCSEPGCELCIPCMSPAAVRGFHQAYREHQRRGEFSRIFPTTSYLQAEMMKQFTEINQLSVKWFDAKCEKDDDWC